MSYTRRCDNIITVYGSIMTGTMRHIKDDKIVCIDELGDEFFCYKKEDLDKLINYTRDYIWSEKEY